VDERILTGRGNQLLETTGLTMLCHNRHIHMHLSNQADRQSIEETGSILSTKLSSSTGFAGRSIGRDRFADQRGKTFASI